MTEILIIFIRAAQKIVNAVSYKTESLLHFVHQVSHSWDELSYDSGPFYTQIERMRVPERIEQEFIIARTFKLQFTQEHKHNDHAQRREWWWNICETWNIEKWRHRLLRYCPWHYL